jgi:hypothetical protein
MSYVDGSYSSPFLISNVVTYPFPWPNNSTVAQYDLEFVQFQNAYTPASLDDTSIYAPSAFLVNQGPVTKIGGGVVKFKRLYCQLPQTWGETQEMAYTFPGLSGFTAIGAIWTPYLYRAPITLYVIATITHTFTHGTTPPTLNTGFIVSDGGNVVDYIGFSNPNYTSILTSPNFEPATYSVKSESKLLTGLIWEVVDAVVAKPI